jgi:hypothetical protein
MSVDGVTARVGQVLGRAESLFSVPADGRGATFAGAVGSAVDASHAITRVSQDFSGAAANAHAAAVGAAAERLQDGADADGALHAELADAGTNHRRGRLDAAAVRAGAAEIPAAIGSLGHLPAGEFVALATLRSRVAAMQDLVTRHSEEASRVAAVLRELGYR